MGIATYPAFLGNLAPSTTRGPSPSLWNWNGSPVNMNTFQGDPNTGLFFWEDFKNAGPAPATGSAGTFSAANGWYAYLTTGGTITDGGTIGGAVKLYGGTSAAQGVALGSLTNSYQILNSSAAFQGRLMFECSVNLSAASLAASTADMFIGLMDASGLPASNVPITATPGNLATAAGFIGFHKRGGTTNPGDWNFVFNAAGGTPQYPTNMQGLVLSVTGAALTTGPVKLGFVFNPFAEQQLITAVASSFQSVGQLARPVLTVYVNGQACSTYLINTDVNTTSFPSTIMGPAIAFTQQSSTALVSSIVDWMGIGQMAMA